MTENEQALSNYVDLVIQSGYSFNDGTMPEPVRGTLRTLTRAVEEER